MSRWDEWDPTQDDDAAFRRAMDSHDGKMALLFVVALCALVLFLMAVSGK